MTTQLRAALSAALEVEHQVVYGYGVAGAHLVHRRDRTAALRRLAEHQELRDALAAAVSAAGGVPAVAAPAYALPFPVTDQVGAARLAVRLEDATAGACWDVVAAAPAKSSGRRLAVPALAAAATWALHWRALAPAAAPPPALPGQPTKPNQPG